MIHPTALVSAKAALGQDVQIGPFCVVGDHVTLGDRCVLHSHVVIEGPSEIGTDNEFFPYAVIGGKTQDLKYQGEPTRLIVGDRNIFRENVTVHRSTFADPPTVVGSDNTILAYCHVAHECRLGNHIILSNGVQVAGHIHIDDHVVVSGLTGMHQFIRLGRHCMVGGCSRLPKDVPPYMIAEGNPATVRAINHVGLTRRGFSEADQRALRTAYKRLFLKKDTNLAMGLQTLKQESAMENEHVRHLVEFIESSERGIIR